jgi:hypothetical protein
MKQPVLLSCLGLGLVLATVAGAMNSQFW